MSDYEERKKWRDWDDWPHERGWDQFTELVSTLEDEVLPERVVLDDDFRKHVTAEVVKFILTDPDMRALMVELLALNPPAILGDEEHPQS